MTAAAKPRAPAVMPLYPSEREIAEAVLGPERWQEWSGLSQSLERNGMPKRDALFGARYWPAVRAWLDRRHGVNRMPEPVEADGEENWS